MESSKSRMVALLLCFFLGTLGAHRFYVGKIGTGVVWLLTLGGGFGIGHGGCSLYNLFATKCKNL